MTRNAKIWLGTAPAIVLVLSIVWRVPGWLGVVGTARWILVGILAFVVTLGGVLVGHFLAKRQPPPPPPKDPISIETDSALHEAERRLVAARIASGRVLQKLPAIFVLGPQGNQKTSSVVKSGLQAELLAGDVMRGIQIVPTQSINVWFAKRTVLIELGDQVTRDAERFARVLQRLQPARLGTAITRGVQAARIAVVCCSCDNLMGAAARETVLGLGRALRATLGGIAEMYGVRLPVYVLFTKADVVPGFREYVKHFSAGEAREVLGATLPLPGSVTAAEYADLATSRFRRALRVLYESLAKRRIDVLGRGDVAQDRAKAYQFPREVRKLESVITDFLVELGRPSDLAVSPFIRGFYFSGVREVVVDSAAPEVLADVALATADPPEGATALLGALPRRRALIEPSIVSGSMARREAQWVFLDRLYASVLLEDATALGSTRGGTRISFFRRAALAAGCALAAGLVVALLVSFVGNRGLTRATKHRLAAVVALPDGPVTVPARAQLDTLDSLGYVLDTLSQYVKEDRPLRLQWGLFTGEPLYLAARQAHYQQFARLLLDSTYALLVARLDSATTGAITAADYGFAYNRLKAYLITTHPQHWSKSTEDFLGPVLLNDKPERFLSDSGSHGVAQRQYSRYARELRYALFASRPVNELLVANSQKFLREAAGDVPIYQRIVGNVSARLKSVDFARDFGARSAGALHVPHIVPGAYTRRGWDSVRISIDDLPRFLNAEEWVLGPAGKLSADQIDTLKSHIRSRYNSDYIGNWRTFVRSASVPGFGNLAAAGDRLTILSGGGSPFIVLFTLVHENVPRVDTARFNRYFDPAVKLGASSMSTPAPTDVMKPYLSALADLAAKIKSSRALDREADFSDAAEQYQAVLGAVDAVTSAVSNIQYQLDPDVNREFGATQLLDQPANFARSLLKGELASAKSAGTKKKVNEAGAAFCGSFSKEVSKRPFRVDGQRRENASTADVQALLGPNGTLHNQLAQGLAEVVSRSGSTLVPLRGAPVQLTSAAAEFLKQLNLLSQAIFPQNQSEPQIEFRIAPVLSGSAASATIEVSGRQLRFDRSGQAGLQLVTWRPDVDTKFIIRGLSANDATDIGPWAVVSRFENAARWSEQGDTVFFNDLRGVPFRVVMQPPVRELLRGNIFRGSTVCPTEWVR